MVESLELNELSGKIDRDFLLSQKEYCLKNHIGEKTAKAKIEQGLLPAFKTLNRVYIPKSIDDSLELKEAKEAINSGCTVISTGNHKGGVLKTTNTLNIAASMAFMGYRVLIVDTDPQANSTKGFGIFMDTHDVVKYNVIQLLLDISSDLSDEEYEQKIKKCIVPIQREYIFGKLDIIPNDPTMLTELKKIDEITNAENGLDYILEFLKNDYDFIIIDTPPRTDTILKIGLMASDYFIVSLKPEPFATLGIPDIFKPIKEVKRAYRMRKNRDLIVLGGIVADVGSSNAHKTSIKQNKEDIKKLTNNTASIFKIQISHAEKVGESQYGDGAMIFTNFKHYVTHEYLELTNEIIEKIIEIEGKQFGDNFNGLGEQK